MTMPVDVAELARRIEQIENALADAQARLPGIVTEVRALREALIAATADAHKT